MMRSFYTFTSRSVDRVFILLLLVGLIILVLSACDVYLRLGLGFTKDDLHRVLIILPGAAFIYCLTRGWIVLTERVAKAFRK
ncbi:hypothetical protein DM480_13495 [Sphingomonas sp. FARSPH]|jgi:hypothetical protein|nr:hypothetical protein DM480_13495 [Sphingomonas sp. FARSPH]